MKKDKLIIIILSSILVILTSFLIYKVVIYNTKYEIRESKEKYYKKLENKLDKFLMMHYFESTIAMPEVREKKITQITLEDLEKNGYPMEEFVGYDGKLCDKKSTYSIGIIKDNKYERKVYYKCGSDTNIK